MSKTQAFFNDYLPGKLSANPDLAGKVDQIFQFEIEGADHPIRPPFLKLSILGQPILA